MEEIDYSHTIFFDEQNINVCFRIHMVRYSFIWTQLKKVKMDQYLKT